MDRQSVLDAFESEVERNADVQRAEFRIFRPNGILSAIYFTAFEDETIAALEAEKMRNLGIRSKYGEVEKKLIRSACSIPDIGSSLKLSA
jgi:hypothetical protein